MAPVKFNENDLDKIISELAFPGYNDLVELREIVDDCIAGLRTNDEKSKYLPPNNWQSRYPQKYQEFLRRALFPNETKYSIDIYEGLFNIGDPQITLPDDGRMNYLVSDASVTRDSLKQIQVRLNKEQRDGKRQSPRLKIFCGVDTAAGR